MSNGSIESRFQWVFGTAAVVSSIASTSQYNVASPNNVLGSTGGGVAFNTHGLGQSFTFLIETDASATCSYQIRTSRASAGPWAILSSGTLSTFASDVVQVPGPLAWLSPRLKTINSTANQVVVRMTAQ